MATRPRREVIDESVVGSYHCTARCVRRAHLCGKDHVSGKNYSHRRRWIKRRVKKLVGLFAVEVQFSAIMSNHMHLILRNRPDLVARWTDREVLLRACQIFPSVFKRKGIDGEPTDEQMQMLLRQREFVEEMRARMSSISWFMRQLCQNIARRANEEDERTGCFWDGRFRSVPLLDETAILVCAIYVDLNPIRAGEVERPEHAIYSSVWHRIRARQRRAEQRGAPPNPDAWLAPLGPERAGLAEHPPAGIVGGCRASNKPAAAISFEQYLELLDWTGRQVRSDKRGSIPDHLAPIVQRIGVRPEAWLQVITGFRQLFGVAVGKADSLEGYARRQGRRWLQRARLAESLFLPN